MARPDTSAFKSLLAGASGVAVLLPRNPSWDGVAAALAFKLGLEATGKIVTVACPDVMTVEFNRLVGVNTVTTSFGSRNLVIAFPGQTEVVDKVTYNVENDELQLLITPKPGTAGVDYRRLKFISGGATADLIIMVGVEQLTDLGQIYLDAKDILGTVKLVSVTHQSPLENYAAVGLWDAEAACLSEIITHLFDSLAMPMSADCASNLLSGLEKATDNFTADRVSETTFAAAAILMRRGAKRHEVLAPTQVVPGSVPAPPPPAPAADWFAPKVYQGATLP